MGDRLEWTYDFRAKPYDFCACRDVCSKSMKDWFRCYLLKSENFFLYSDGEIPFCFENTLVK